MEVLLGYIFIFSARVIDVAMGTTRMLMIVRGRRIEAAAIGFVEVIVYIIALNMVIQQLDQILNLLVYAFGFAMGNYVGCYVEEKMALGYVTVQVIPRERNVNLANNLRSLGYGVTVINGWGKEGTRQILNIMVKRKYLRKLMTNIDEFDHDSFINIMETRTIYGGYLGHKKK